MKRKLLITGSSGFLGCRLALHFKGKYDLLLPAHDELNICREEAVRTFLEEHRPDVVVHCAALSNTGYCEQHPDESHRVNVQGTVRVAKACKAIGAKLIFMSSDQVYNGTHQKGPLEEDVALMPVNVYGRHKLEAEQRALWNLPDAVGLRLTWMYDLPTSFGMCASRSAAETLRSSRNILVCLQNAHDEGTTLNVATHDHRGVTNVWDVVRNIERAIALPGGVYNFGSGSTLNTHDLYCEAARLMGFETPAAWICPDDKSFVQDYCGTGSEDTCLGRNLTMDCARIAQHGIHFLDSVEGIAEAIAHPYRHG